MATFKQKPFAPNQGDEEQLQNEDALSSSSSGDQELEQYGVWVKTGPEDVSDDGDLDEDFHLSDLEESDGDLLLTDEEEKLLGPLEEEFESGSYESSSVGRQTSFIDEGETGESEIFSFEEEDFPSLPEEMDLSAMDDDDDLLELENLPDLEGLDTASDSEELFTIEDEESPETSIDYERDEIFGEEDFDDLLAGIEDDSAQDALSGTSQQPPASPEDESFTDVTMEDFLESDIGEETAGGSDSVSASFDEEFLDIDLSLEEEVGEDDLGEALLPSADEELREIEIEAPSDEELPELEIDEEDFSFDVESFDEEDEVEVPLSEGSVEEQQFDDLAAVTADLASFDLEEEFPEPAVTDSFAGASVPRPSSTDERELSLLQKIENELLSIKDELASLKTELSHLRSSDRSDTARREDLSEEEAAEGSGFFDDDEDETIALTGDELDNILNTADITEEAGEATDLAEEQDILLSPSSSNEDPFDELDIDLGMDLEQSMDLDVPTDSNADFDERLIDREEIIDLDEEVAAAPGHPAADKTEDAGEPDAMMEIEEITLEDEESPELLTDDFEIEFEDELPPNPDDVSLFEPDSNSSTVKQFEDDFTLEEIELSLPEADFSEMQEPSSFSDSDHSLEIDESDEMDEAESLESLDPEEESFDDILDIGSGNSVLEIPQTPEAALSTAEGPERTLPEDLKREIRSVLSYMDQLLESLPDDKIHEFSQSEHFEVYRRLFDELGLSR